jgi:hypothetical protein
MTSAASSLLDRSRAAGEQLDLIPSSEMPAALFDGPRNPAFTAERYAKMHAAEYKLAASLLFGDRLPVRQVAAMLGASPNLIAAIYEREQGSESVEAQKRQAAAAWRTITRLGRERITEFLLHLPDAKDLSTEQMAGLLHKIGIVVGIAADKLAQLDGTVVPQVRINVNVDAAGYSDMLARARALAARMGLEGETGATKGDGGGMVLAPDGGDGARTVEAEARGCEEGDTDE